MNILIYAHADEHSDLEEMITGHGNLQYRQLHLTMHDEFRDFTQSLQEQAFDVVLVTANGAGGMEGVIAAKHVQPCPKVIWFSDDKYFGAQSYRLDCSYFGVKPVTSEKIERAFAHC